VTDCHEGTAGAGSVNGSGYAREPILILRSGLRAQPVNARVTAEIRRTSSGKCDRGRSGTKTGYAAPVPASFSYANSDGAPGRLYRSPMSG